MGVIGCILGFLIVIYLCYKDWSVYLATFAGACVVIACNTLPFIDSLVGDYVSGMFTAVKSFFFMILFGCLQSKDLHGERRRLHHRRHRHEPPAQGEHEQYRQKPHQACL